MNNEINYPERLFQMWRYEVGHGQLLFRSTKSPEYPTRVDVLFKNVALIQMPTVFNGMAVRLTDATPSVELGKLALTGRRIFEITGTGVRGYVIASIVMTHEDEGNHGDPSPLLT
jgi:hypothetical protein